MASLFIDVATAAGVDDVATPPLGPDYPGHRSAIGGFLDYDRDGWLDPFVGAASNSLSTNFFFMNNRDGRFRDESATSGVSFPGDTKGGAAADYDHDGDFDFAFVDHQDPETQPFGALYLMRNDTPKSGHWLAVRLAATVSNRSAIGARVRLRAGELELVIEWPSGAVNTWRDLQVDQLHAFTEQVDDHLALAADPVDVGGDETLTLTTTGGVPGMLNLLAVTDVDGAPTFIDLDLGVFDAGGARVFSAFVPAGCFSGLDVGFQAIGFESWSGKPGWSAVQRVTFQ